jgi:ribosomal protein L29
LRRKVAEWVPAADNLRQIKEVGLENWLKVQKERQALTEDLLQNYNEGRSMSFYCKACARMSIELINKALKEAKEKLVSERVDESDMQSKANILKTVIKDLALKTNVNLN